MSFNLHIIQYQAYVFNGIVSRFEVHYYAQFCRQVCCGQKYLFLNTLKGYNDKKKGTKKIIQNIFTKRKKKIQNWLNSKGWRIYYSDAWLSSSGVRVNIRKCLSRDRNTALRSKSTKTCKHVLPNSFYFYSKRTRIFVLSYPCHSIVSTR